MNWFPILLALTEVIVTIDGSGNRSDPSLKPWALSIGSYVENVVNDGPAVTDPAHGMIYGAGNVGKCLNFIGHPADPMHFELLEAQDGASSEQCVIVSAKGHLLEFNRHSEFYGETYPATTVHVATDTVRCGIFSDSTLTEGPDSLAIEAAIAYLDSVPGVRFLGLNLARTDMWGHTGLSCLDGDFPTYQAVGDSIFQAAVHLVRDRLWPWLQSDPRYAGQVVMLLTTDHGFHTNGQPVFQHGHGYLPDSTCAPNCPGCSDLWAIFAGPGVAVGVEASGCYQIGDLAPTVRFLMGFLNPYEAGEPIAEVLSATGVKLAQPARTALQGRVWDVTGRRLRSEPAQGIYFGRGRRFLIVR